MDNIKNKKVKIDVITGFLGAGKTTFIKAMIDEKVFGHEKVMIIENDFGEINIDSIDLSSSHIDVIELTNGCICCSLKGELIESLKKIYTQIKPDRILIEPSGIFNLSDLASIMTDPTISSKFILNGIYTIVDLAQYKLEKMRFSSFYYSQIKYANHIILSKLKEDKEVEKQLKEIRSTNKHAIIHEVTSLLWNKELGEMCFFNNIVNFNMDDLNKSEVEYQTITNQFESPHGSKDKGLSSFGVYEVKRYTQKGFDKFLENIQKGNYGDIIRGKGYVNIENKFFRFNLVNSQIDLKEIDYKYQSQLVFIGMNIQKTKLKLELKPIVFKRLYI